MSHRIHLYRYGAGRRRSLRDRRRSMTCSRSRGGSGGQRHRDQPRQDHQEGEKHLDRGRDQRRAPGGRHGVRRHGPLHDQEVRAPVAEGQNEAEAHDQTHPLHAEAVMSGIVQTRPGMDVAGAEAVAEPLPAADRFQSQPHEGCEAGHDQEELKHLVVDRAPEAAEVDIHQHHQRRGQHGGAEDPARRQPHLSERRIQQVQGLDQLGHRVHRDAGGEDGHDGEGHGVETAGLLVEAHAQVLGGRAGLGAVVEGHHEDADEDHGRDGAQPIEVRRGDAVLGARGAHADDFLSPQVGRDEGQAADPGGDRPTREEEVGAALGAPRRQQAYGEHKDDVDSQDGPVDRCHARLSPPAGGRPGVLDRKHTPCLFILQKHL